MPHNFIQISPSTPNPGRWTRPRVDEIVTRHHGTLEHLWFDDPNAPEFAYVLVRDGDVDGLMTDLHGLQVTRLFDAG